MANVVHQQIAFGSDLRHLDVSAHQEIGTANLFTLTYQVIAFSETDVLKPAQIRNVLIGQTAIDGTCCFEKRLLDETTFPLTTTAIGAPSKNRIYSRVIAHEMRRGLKRLPHSLAEPTLVFYENTGWNAIFIESVQDVATEHVPSTVFVNQLDIGSIRLHNPLKQRP